MLNLEQHLRLILFLLFRESLLFSLLPNQSSQLVSTLQFFSFVGDNSTWRRYLSIPEERVRDCVRQSHRNRFWVNVLLQIFIMHLIHVYFLRAWHVHLTMFEQSLESPFWNLRFACYWIRPKRLEAAHPNWLHACKEKCMLKRIKLHFRSRWLAKDAALSDSSRSSWLVLSNFKILNRKFFAKCAREVFTYSHFIFNKFQLTFSSFSSFVVVALIEIKKCKGFTY